MQRQRVCRGQDACRNVDSLHGGLGGLRWALPEILLLCAIDQGRSVRWFSMRVSLKGVPEADLFSELFHLFGHLDQNDDTADR